MIDDVVRRSRSYRRFYQETAIGMDTLRELVDLARYSPSGGNLQPLKYILSADPEKNGLIFQNLAWAGYLKDWPGPEREETIRLYHSVGRYRDKQVGCLGPRDFGPDHNAGRDLKGIWWLYYCHNQQKERLRSALSIPARYEILLVLALGKPKEIVVIDPVGARWKYQILA